MTNKFPLNYSINHIVIFKLPMRFDICIKLKCRRSIMITHSHGSASVLKATKQVNGKGQNSTLATPKALYPSSWLRPGRHPACKICSDRFRGFCSPNTCFCRAFGVTSFLFVFWGSSIRLQPTPLDGYLRKIRQMTSFQVRKCLWGVTMTIFYIWTLNRKTAISGTDFDWTVFLQPKTALTWGCSNINYP